MNPCIDNSRSFEQEQTCAASECAAALHAGSPAQRLPAHAGDLASRMVLASVAGWALRRSYNHFNDEGERK